MINGDLKVRRVGVEVGQLEPAAEKRLRMPETTRVPIEQVRATHGSKPGSTAPVRKAPEWIDSLASVDLAGYIEEQRWFGGKARELTGVKLDSAEPLPGGSYLAVVRTEYAEGDPERYVMLLAAAKGRKASAVARDFPKAVIGQVKSGRSSAMLYDAMRTEDGTRALLKVLQPTSAWKPVDPDQVELEVISKEQSNTSVRVGQDYMIKLLRRMSEGVNPDYEVGRFLTEETKFDRVPSMAGAVELADGSTMAILQALVKGARDAWEFTLESVGDHRFAGLAQMLGKRTAELHLALRSEAAEKNADFKPEPFTHDDMRALGDRMRENLARVLDVLEQKRDLLEGDAVGMAEKLLAGREKLLAKIDALTASVPDGAIKTRVHGDYHLGQVLVDHTGKDFFIIDFEGEPTRPLAERRGKAAPEKDVAGMLRSFDYAGRAGYAPGPEWSAAMQRAFLDGYEAAVGAKSSPLLEAYVLDKAIYELDYEVNNRPSWAAIPLGALLASL